MEIIDNKKKLSDKKTEFLASEHVHLPREYAMINIEEKSVQHSNVEDFDIKWNSVDDYRVIQKIGRGKYSEVFSGLNVKN